MLMLFVDATVGALWISDRLLQKKQVRVSVVGISQRLYAL